MHGFPALDGIPLPAPVWLFKILHVLLLSLHLVAMQYMVGSLMACAQWEWRGRRPGRAALLDGSRQLARWLPTVMTFVINLGVPPLLFAQVLYGTALYTSSALIGAFWIGVILWLLLMYTLIYVGQTRSIANRVWTWPAVGAAGLGLLIAATYTTNMVLMTRPDVWAKLYQASPSGTNWPFGDASIWPRWLFMMAGTLVIGGLGSIMLAGNDRRPANLRRMYLREGGAMVVVGAIVQLPALAMAIGNLPHGVAAALGESTIYSVASLLWIVLWLAALAAGVGAATKGEVILADARSRLALGAGAPALAVLLTLMMVTVRDGIRDLSLRAAGFDVWSWTSAPNLGVLVIFLVMVVLAVVTVGILVTIAVKAAPPEEYAAP